MLNVNENHVSWGKIKSFMNNFSDFRFPQNLHFLLASFVDVTLIY